MSMIISFYFLFAVIRRIKLDILLVLCVMCNILTHLRNLRNIALLHRYTSYSLPLPGKVDQKKVWNVVAVSVKTCIIGDSQWRLSA